MKRALQRFLTHDTKLLHSDYHVTLRSCQRTSSSGSSYPTLPSMLANTCVQVCNWQQHNISHVICFWLLRLLLWLTHRAVLADTLAQTACVKVVQVCMTTMWDVRLTSLHVRYDAQLHTMCWLVHCLAELAQKSELDRPHR